MTAKKRDTLLDRMDDEVGRLVLRSNYQQTQALSVAEAHGVELLDSGRRLMRSLERDIGLDRTIEFLPDEETLDERRKSGIGLTRPELSVLLGYGKMALFDALIDSDLPEDPYLAVDLERYFPEPLRKDFKAAIHRHGLRRQIIATVATNSMVNRVGAAFVNQIAEETEFSADQIARAYTITRDSFRLRPLWEEIEGLDNTAPSATQTAMLIDICRNSRSSLKQIQRSPLLRHDDLILDVGWSFGYRWHQMPHYFVFTHPAATAWASVQSHVSPSLVVISVVE
ncbi:MAG: NAD-glutamate dehydrogenase [Acidobacteria bacterium]|nr:NAD-glutamate dehydrogenase [Acidobacteriota bacterium]